MERIAAWIIVIALVVGALGWTACMAVVLILKFKEKRRLEAIARAKAESTGSGFPEVDRLQKEMVEMFYLKGDGIDS